MENWFYKIYQWGQKNKFLFYSCMFFLLIVSGWGAWNTKFEEDITRILPKSEESNVVVKLLDQLKFSDKITVIIERESEGSTDEMVALATGFLDSLQSEKRFVKNIKGTVDDSSIQQTISFVYEHLPLFLDENDYKLLDNKVHIDSIAPTVATNYRSLISPTSLVSKDFIQKDPFGIGFIALQKLQQLNVGGNFHIIDGFLFDKNEAKLFLFIDPVYAGSETKNNSIFIQKLNNLKAKLNQDYAKRVSIDYFGASFVAVANADQIKQDIQKTVVISISVLMLLLMVFYRRIHIPFLLLVPTAISAIIALFILYFIKDAISAISLSIGAILIGITIDYALHILTHYKHSGDIRVLYQDITKPIMMSATTTAIAFLCLVFVHSEALRDLGIFAAITVMGAGVFSLLLIPQLYTPSEKEIASASRIKVLDRIANFPFDTNKWVLGICLLTFGISAFFINKVGFNNDLSTLNYFPEELKQAEQKLEQSLNSESKSLYLTCYGTDLDVILDENSVLYARLKEAKEEGLINQFSTLGDFVVSQKKQEEKIARWNAFWDRKNRKTIEESFQKQGELFGFNKEAYQPFYDILSREYKPLNMMAFKTLNPQIIEEFYTEKEGHYTVSTLVKVSEDKRADFISEFSNTERFMVIDRKEINEAFLGNIVKDFNSLVNYSIIAVFGIMWLFYKRIELALVGLIPIVITGFITAGLMGMFNIEFTIFSTIVCTLIFGQGVDFTIFMTSALQKEYTTGKNEMPLYRASILLAVLTTLLAIGTLVFAKHPALKSISLVSIIGMSVAALISFVLYPYIFRICFTNRQRKGKSPISLRLLLHSSLSFIYFGLCGAFYSLVIRLVMILMPWSEKRKMIVFRKGMGMYMKSVLYSNPFVLKQVKNPYDERFEKPAILIANHTSFLDSLVMGGMVHNKVAFLVNDWVYRSPVFGKAVQSAGFYPVSEGIDGSVDHLKKQLDFGFSLMVFPEGTRSRTNDIQRFHKGAFFLAEQLQLDIIPVYIHGNSETIPKGDTVIYDGHIITTIGKRIAFDDDSFGKNYSERTKLIGRSFKKEFAVIRENLEGVNYFKKKLFLAYLYKKPEIVKEVKKDFERYSYHYYELNKQLGSKDTIVHVGNDLGQLDLLLVLQQSKRKVFSFISNEERRSVAQHTYVNQIRKLMYWDSLEVVPSATLLISNLDEVIPLEYIKQFSKVILLKKEGVSLSLAPDYERVLENEFLEIWKL